MALIIAGERSGVGKTTITLALLSFLSSKGDKVQSFKVGPDYIDPMFHTAITGRPCRNLDPILTSEAYVQSCFNHHCQTVDYALVEGVMGLFDGVPIKKDLHSNPTRRVRSQRTISHSKFCLTPKHINDCGSTAHIARLLNLPVLLAIDCSKLSGSVAALVNGYRYFDPQVNIIGLVLNKVGSDRHLELLEQALEPLNLPILGVLRRREQIILPDRHLGLIPTEEVANFQQIVAQLAHLAKNSFNWSQLRPYLYSPKYPTQSSSTISLLTEPRQISQKTLTIAVARDRAFNFYYQDNLDILQELGAELIYWSPLTDPKLPENTAGIYLGGGFPEIFTAQLSDNQEALLSVKQAIFKGIPTYAECGGLMYLCEAIEDFEGNQLPMVGILPTTAAMTKKLTLGYRQVIALQDNPFSEKNTILWGHEFHRSQISSFPDKPLLVAKTAYGKEIVSYQGWKLHQVYASYIHLHFGIYQSQITRFLTHCLKVSSFPF